MIWSNSTLRRQLSIDDGVDRSSRGLKLSFKVDLHFDGIEWIETDFNAFAGQMRRSFIETAKDEERGIASDESIDAIEEQAAQVGGWRQLTDVFDVPLPALEWRGFQSSVFFAVIDRFEPRLKARIEFIKRSDLARIDAR